MKISTIIFDIGKVLVNFDFSKAIQAASLKSTLSANEIGAVVFQDPILIDYELGRISTHDFFSHVHAQLQFDGFIEELEFLWSNIFTVLDHHVNLARLLSPCYTLAVLSNTAEAHIRYLETHYDFLNIFPKAHRFYSYEMNLMKPQPEIYEAVLNKLGADRYETLFIDDREENVITPSKMGWQTIHLRPDVNLELALQSYELKGI